MNREANVSEVNLMPTNRKLKSEEKFLLLVGGGLLALIGGILVASQAKQQERFRVGYY